MELSPVIPPGTPVRKEDGGEERSCDNDCLESRFQVCALGPDSASKAQTFESARSERSWATKLANKQWQIFTFLGRTLTLNSLKIYIGFCSALPGLHPPSFLPFLTFSLWSYELS